MRIPAVFVNALLCLALCLGGAVDPAQAAGKWVAVWTGSGQGPYPVGNPSAQPDLKSAFPQPKEGANDQTFRLIVRPDAWGPKARIRLSNALGDKPVTFDGVFVGMQLNGPALIPGSNRAVTFDGQAAVTVPPGRTVWSDPVDVSLARNPKTPLLQGRKLAVSFHVAGRSGPMTWHAKALTTSYVTNPGAGSRGAEEGEAAFVNSTASWYFLDAVDMSLPESARLVVCFGDSITDGTASTMNGDDRWSDVLARRLHAASGNAVSVVNAGIGGNQVAGPAEYGPDKPFPGGPSSKARLERDVLSLSGVSTVIWLEGINDFSKNGNAEAAAVIAGMRDGVARMRAALPGVRILGATVTTALGSSSAAHGFPEQDAKRKELNAFIRTSGVFDGVIDFDAVVLDPATGGMRAQFVPESTTGGPGDKLHPNRAGYLAMGQSIDLIQVLGDTPAMKKRK